MDNTTTTDNLHTPRRHKRRRNVALSPPDAPRKRLRHSDTSVALSGGIEEWDPVVPSSPKRKLPASRRPENIVTSSQGLPLSRTPSDSGEGPAPVDRFLNDHELRSKAPNEFIIVLRDFSTEDIAKLQELGLYHDYHGLGRALRVTWAQLARLIRLKLAFIAMELPDTFEEVMQIADEEAKALDFRL